MRLDFFPMAGTNCRLCFQTFGGYNRRYVTRLFVDGQVDLSWNFGLRLQRRPRHRGQWSATIVFAVWPLIPQAA